MARDSVRVRKYCVLNSKEWILNILSSRNCHLETKLNYIMWGFSAFLKTSATHGQTLIRFRILCFAIAVVANEHIT